MTTEAEPAVNGERSQEDFLQGVSRITSILRWRQRILKRQSLAIGMIFLLQFGILISSLALYFVTKSGRYIMVDVVAAGLMLASSSTICFFAILLSLFKFESHVKSARIESSELSDALSWYRHVNEDNPRTVDINGERGFELRILLREIAENSFLPLARTSSASLIYAGASLFLISYNIYVVITTIDIR